MPVSSSEYQINAVIQHVLDNYEFNCPDDLHIGVDYDFETDAIRVSYYFQRESKGYGLATYLPKKDASPEMLRAAIKLMIMAGEKGLEAVTAPNSLKWAVEKREFESFFTVIFPIADIKKMIEKTEVVVDEAI